MTDTAHNTNTCGYGEQLVGYLYGEANAAERRDFERHLEACSACHDELAAFGFVRVAVGEWRQAVRQQAPALALADSLILKGESALPAPARPARDWRHAVSSLREFFTLSPVWMQAGTVAAALVVCALAALAVARVEVRRDVGGIAISFGAGQSLQPQQPKVAAPSEPVDTQREVEQLTAQLAAAREELAATQERLGSARQQAAVLEAKIGDEPRPPSVAASRSGEPITQKRRPKSSPRNNNSDIAREDGGVPSLLDLLGETYED